MTDEVMTSTELGEPSLWESGFTFMGFLTGFAINVGLTQNGILPAKAYTLLAGSTVVLTPLITAMVFSGAYCFVSGLVAGTGKR